jgi:hypothetical protein
LDEITLVLSNQRTDGKINITTEERKPKPNKMAGYELKHCPAGRMPKYIVNEIIL